MELPKAEDLKAIFAAARECGVTRLEITADGFRAELTPRSLVEDIEARASTRLVDPISVIRAQEAGRPVPGVQGMDERPDILEALASGAQLVPTDTGDPTQAAT